MSGSGQGHLSKHRTSWGAGERGGSLSSGTTLSHPLGTKWQPGPQQCAERISLPPSHPLYLLLPPTLPTKLLSHRPSSRDPVSWLDPPEPPVPMVSLSGLSINPRPVCPAQSLSQGSPTARPPSSPVRVLGLVLGPCPVEPHQSPSWLAKRLSLSSGCDVPSQPPLGAPSLQSQLCTTTPMWQPEGSLHFLVP